MKDQYEILHNRAEAILHAKKFHYELFRDEEAQLVTDCYDIPTEGNNHLHFHNCIEILYAESGSFFVTLDGTEQELHTGEFCVVPSFVIHDCTVYDNARRWVILIPPVLLGSTAKILEEKTFDRCIQKDDGTMLTLLKMLQNANNRNGRFFSHADAQNHTHTVRSLASSVVSVAVCACGLKEQSGSSVLLIELIRFLHLHFREPIRISEIAHKLLCTQKTLSDQFRRVFKMTIGSYINHLRALDVMYTLREHPDMCLSEVAEQSGFGSVRNMLRAYRREFGCTPKESKSEILDKNNSAQPPNS